MKENLMKTKIKEGKALIKVGKKYGLIEIEIKTHQITVVCLTLEEVLELKNKLENIVYEELSCPQ
jgi:UPF0288 family protein (methanogenesis marker protein 3)